MRRLLIFAFLLLYSSVRLNAQSTEPEALLVHVVLAVRVHHAGHEMNAAIGLPLFVGDRVTIDKGGRALILHRNGRIEVLTRSSVIKSSNRTETSGFMQQTLALLSDLAVVDARTQPNRAAMIRPAKGSALQVQPRDGITILDVRPTFTWRAAEGNKTYTVRLGRKGAAPRAYDAISDTVWTLPAYELPLLPGAEYEWTVVAVETGRLEATTTFHVISPAALATLTQRLSDLAKAGVDFEGDGLLLAASVYYDAGLIYDAVRALERLLASGAPLSPQVAQLHLTLLNRINGASMNSR